MISGISTAMKQKAESVCAMAGITKGSVDMDIKEAEEMFKEELIKISVEEFSRLQRYMVLAERDSQAYKAMKERHIDLKAILTASGMNLTEIDRIKE